MICSILLYYLDNRTTINPEIHEALHVGEKAISIAPYVATKCL